MGIIARGLKLASGTINFLASSKAKSSEVNTDFNTVYSLVNGNIDNDNIAADAAIESTKLDLITAPGKVSGTALTDLDQIPLGAGIIPTANLPSLTTDLTTEVTGILPIANGGTGQSDNGSAGEVMTSAGDGTSYWGNGAGRQTLTSSGTWTSPAGVTLVYVTGLAGGGGGGGGLNGGDNEGGGGGGGGASLVKYPFVVSPSTGYSYSVGAAGSGGSVGSNNATAGGNTTFSTITLSGGALGVGGSSTGAGGAGGSSSLGFLNGTAGSNTSGSTGGAGGVGCDFLGKGGTSNGGAGAGYGSGGGGGNGAGSATAGGAGGTGFLLLEW